MPPPRRWIDKKSATTYKLFHRSQNDPLIHDPDADDRVLYQVSGPALPASGPQVSNVSKTLADLEEEFGASGIRENEGEAANYGVFYDDSNYDYMQHLRDLGDGSGQAYFIEAIPVKVKGKRKEKNKTMRLEDALGESTIHGLEDSTLGDARSVRDDDLHTTASSYVTTATYQDQQDVPDAIAGFQPDMDPRLREVLEALEDDAFVDPGGDEDLFGALVEGGRGAEVDASEWRDTYIEDGEDGWESDVTEKAPTQPGGTGTGVLDVWSAGSSDKTAGTDRKPENDDCIPDTTPADGDWLRNFSKYKKEMKSIPAPAAQSENASEVRTTASTMFTAGGTPLRKKKRKGALTNSSTYSMTSSSLARTEGLRLLDDRFEKIEALYALDEEDGYGDSSMADDMSVASGMSRSSQAPSLVSQSSDFPLRSDFDQVMDGFLDEWVDRAGSAKRKGAKGKRGKNGNEAVGMRMLDEIRQGLGPARVSGRV